MTAAYHELRILTRTLVLAELALCAGCGFRPQQGRPTANSLVLAHRCDRPGHGFDYQSLWKNLHIRSELFSNHGPSGFGWQRVCTRADFKSRVVAIRTAPERERQRSEEHTA